MKPSQPSTYLSSLSGETLASRYLVGTLIAVGGMGAVYRGVDLKYSAPVAIKVMLPNRANITQVIRFKREARLMARLSHPNIVKIFNFGRWGPEGERYYLVMELVEGTTLDALLDVEFDTAQICGLLLQIYTALMHSHARDVLHHDIKPSNILVSRALDGELLLKVTDFGIAQALNSTPEDQAKKGEAPGTPNYISPEQITGGFPGPTADIYSTGVILYRLLTGRLPFHGSSAQVMTAKIKQDPLPFLARPHLEVDTKLSDFVMRLIARAPESRPDIATVARDFIKDYARPSRLDDNTWDRLQPLVNDPCPRLPTATTRSVLYKNHRTRMNAQRLWGRQTELTQLRDIFSLVSAGQPQGVLIRGEVGMEQRLLARTLTQSLRESGRCRVLRGRYFSHLAASQSLRDAIEAYLGTTDLTRSHVTRCAEAHLKRYNEPLSSLEDLVSYLRPPEQEGRLAETLQPVDTSLAISDPHNAINGVFKQPQNISSVALQRKNFSVVTRLLRRLAKQRPVLFILESLHDGGEDAIAFILHLTTEMQRDPFPIMLLATMETDKFSDPLERYQPQYRKHFSTMTLLPLRTQELTSKLQRDFGISITRARDLASYASGNPEFARLLALTETHNVQQSTHEHEPNPATAIRVPHLLQSIIEVTLNKRLSKIDHSAHARQLMEHLAVLGERLPFDLISTLLKKTLPALFCNIDTILDALIDLKILTEPQPHLFAFDSPLVRDVVLNSLPLEQARTLHHQAAILLVERGGDPGDIGDHWKAARITDQAVHWWLRAQHTASRRGDPMRSIHYGQLAMTALTADDPRLEHCSALIRKTRKEMDRHVPFSSSQGDTRTP